MGRVKSLRNGSGAAATAARAGAAVWACRPAAGEESAAALEQQRAMAAIRAIFRVWGVRYLSCIDLPAKVQARRQPPLAREFLGLKFHRLPTHPSCGRGALQTLKHFHVRTTPLSRLTATGLSIFAAFAWRAPSYADKRRPAA